jgi:hypothetical protein
MSAALICSVARRKHSWKPTIAHLRHDLALHGFVPSIILTVLCQAVLLRARTAPWGLAILALRGTIAHELAHFIIGFILMAKPSGFSLWPKRSGRGRRLGEVTFRRAGVFNSAFIAMAPLLLFPLGWLCLMHLSAPAWAAGHWIRWLAAAYLAATVFFACVPSLTDIKLGGRSLLVYLIVIGMCWMALQTLRTWMHCESSFSVFGSQV